MIFSTEKNKKELKKYYFRSFQIISDHESFDCFNFCSIYDFGFVAAKRREYI